MKKLILLVFFITCVCASEEIEVNLSTQKPLPALYISKIFNEGSDFSDEYLIKLQSVLQFDLNYNGFTQVVKQEYQKDFKISHFDDDVAFDQNFWKTQKISYVLKSQICKNTFKAYIYNVNINNLKILEGTKLSGDIKKDRKEIHSFCDSLQEMLFGQRGIASSKILYAVKEKNDQNPAKPWKSEVWMCDYDGENAKRLTFENSYLVHPVFVPNKKGNEYVYISYVNGQPKLFKTSINDPKKELLIHLRGNQLLPSFSVDSKKLVFISDASGRPDIFIQHFDSKLAAIGKPIQIYSYPRATNASPVFSPDNEKIAFVSDKDGSPRIYVLKIPDNFYNQKRPVTHLVTKKNRQNVSPSWSRDGKKLAYSAKSESVRQIWIYDFETDEEWQLTYDNKNKENPVWADDSLHIIYNTEDKNEAELYLINIKQKETAKISKGGGRKRFPSFE